MSQASKDVLFVIEPDAQFFLPCKKGLPVPVLHVLGTEPPEDVSRFSAIFVDVALNARSNIVALRNVLSAIPRTLPRCFLTNPGRRADLVQANVLGATTIEPRPLNPASYERMLADFARKPLTFQIDLLAATRSAATALDFTFTAITNAKPLDIGTLSASVSEIGDAIAQDGLDQWLEMVRVHHQGTFQHCLLVTGVLADFGHALGMSKADVGLLTTAGLLHDIGKAKIPLAILEKPEQLTAAERQVIERHPVIGYDYLNQQQGIAREVLDAVRDHHEYLNGSGYPRRLTAGEIGDLTRIVTICDIYGALSERRAYKPPLSPQACVNMLETMSEAGQLEAALVKAFKRGIETGSFAALNRASATA